MYRLSICDNNANVGEHDVALTGMQHDADSARRQVMRRVIEEQGHDLFEDARHPIWNVIQQWCTNQKHLKPCVLSCARVRVMCA